MDVDKEAVKQMLVDVKDHERAMREAFGDEQFNQVIQAQWQTILRQQATLRARRNRKVTVVEAVINLAEAIEEQGLGTELMRGQAIVALFVACHLKAPEEFELE